MEKSQAEWDIYTGNIEPYVVEKIKNRFGEGLANSVPLVSSINIFKKVVDSTSTLYRNAPERSYTELSDEQKETVNLVYRDMSVDAKMLQANRLFEAQKQQTHVIIEPIDGVLRMRPIKAHNINVKPMMENPEKAEVYIFSAFDKTRAENRDFSDDNYHNESIADVNDYKAHIDRYIVWSKDYHFVMNGEGEILIDGVVATDADTFKETNEKGIPVVVANQVGEVPVVEISAMKDFIYWREVTNDSVEFTIDFNQYMSMAGQIVEQQGFAQAVMRGPKEMMSQEVITGPTRIVHVITDPNVPGGDSSDFSFANPGSDLAGVQQYYEALLALYLSSRGVDPSEISGNASASKGFASGVERLLSLISKFEASKETRDIFRNAETKIYSIVKAWMNYSLETEDVLLDKYQVSQLPEESELLINYTEPQGILTEAEKVGIAEKRVELGLWSKKKAVMYLDGVTDEQAVEIIKDADKEAMESLFVGNAPINESSEE